MKTKAIVCLLASACAGAAGAEGVALRSSHGIGRPHSQHAGPINAHSNSNSSADSTSTSSGGVGVGSQGQSLSIDSHAVYEAQRRNPVSTAIAPPIVSSNDTCMGSSSIAGSAVSFGFSAGTTWTDDNCVMLKNSREMWNMGFKGAALARLCMDALNKEAFEVTGINCPPRRQAPAGEQGAQNAQGATIGNAGARTDDIYRY